MLIRCRIPLAGFELDVDASFDAKVTSVFGPSGSGKTTLLDAIAGLRAVSSGEIEMGGNVLFSSSRRVNLPPQRRLVGYVPQEGSLFPHLSVRKNILFGAGRTKSYERVDSISLDHVLDVLEIRGLLDRPVTRLSGGEAQRVALARAILSRPQLLLLDEPLAALDVGLKEKILPYLGRVRDEFSIPMIYVTHNLTEVLSLADWVLMIRQGRLVAQGAPKEVLISTPALMQMEQDEIENVFTVTVVESDPAAGRSRVRLPTGQDLFIPYCPGPANSRLQISLSADDIIVGIERPQGLSAGNILPGIIRHTKPLDGQALLSVDAGELFWVRLTAAAATGLKLEEGKAVFLVMKARSFRIL